MSLSAPCGVTSTFAGLRSRCTTGGSWVCRKRNASHNVTPHCATCRQGNGARAQQRLLQRDAWDVLEHEIVAASLVGEGVVDGGEGGMPQLGKQRRLRLKAGGQPGAFGARERTRDDLLDGAQRATIRQIARH